MVNETIQSLNWTVVQEQDKQILRLAGELSRHTLSALSQAVQQRTFLSAEKINKQNLVWDLSNLERIDSTGFALLCELLNISKQQAESVRLIHIPEQITTLADLFGLSDWFNTFLCH
ncbi:phospholipid transport system transporter-binding protein [Cricetibacter osteomyelitidis]|uniref:Phospholipid transport system transporter-binding protein n=1 Tax=Cricetibacter osteomyelitidis TaxID=1521931 RepID=A0A4R2TLS5_9PAST|nr:STAS domain-containing protein [Cricetibacter osteomyelitidis]TCP95812.1 phospholipid transport system transporter-binding protein [Cricetibacter osteomyelitidis]